MKEFIEKLIGRLEEINYNDIQMVVSEVLKKYGFPKESVVQDEIWDELDGLCTSKPAIEIVNQLAEEYNNGWIPCEFELPTERKSYLVSHGQHTSVYIEEWNGMYFTERNYAGQPLAWQPLPDAYTEGE